MKPKAKEKRSSLETLMAHLLDSSQITHKYEDTVLSYQQPAQKRKYYPDFRIKAGILSANSPEVFLETKGQLTSADRKKMKLIKEQYPEKIVILVFGRASNKLNKARDTTYGDWATQYGYPWIDIKELADAKDLKQCLLRLIKTSKNGKSPNRRRKNSVALLQLAKEL